jgi:tetratricopeptide (TPR) repeat protein
LLRERGRPARELVAPLALLSSAGYAADLAYAARHGEATVAALQETLGLALAPKLSRYVGAKLGILISLVVAGVRLGKHRGDRRVPTLKDTLGLLFASVAALTGAYAACLDADSASRYASVLQPFAALGRKHIAGFMAVYCRLLAQLLRDWQPRTWREWHEMVPPLDTPGAVRGLNESLRRRFLGGALYSLGAIESQRDGAAALEIAERLDKDAGLVIAVMSAEQVRTLYYANQGNLELSEHHRVRVDHHAAQQGNSWQVEMWTCTATLSTALRTHDAMLMKRAAEELSRLSQQVPSLDRSARRARGAYLLLRGSYAKALPWLEEVLENAPRAILGWGRMCGALAHCYNKLGQHERALATCDLVYEHFGAAELSFSPLTSQVQTERLIARAALGQGGDAFLQLDALIARHAPLRGPHSLCAVSCTCPSAPRTCFWPTTRGAPRWPPRPTSSCSASARASRSGIGIASTTRQPKTTHSRTCCACRRAFAFPCR